mmetsp:Transcript_43717/g.93009  ORF Transcript_43717/g.93009 Transcript_43717/m.93009 type:complete len:358 (-) Transcript_43717:1567-2640(-)
MLSFRSCRGLLALGHGFAPGSGALAGNRVLLGHKRHRWTDLGQILPDRHLHRYKGQCGANLHGSCRSCSLHWHKRHSGADLQRAFRCWHVHGYKRHRGAYLQGFLGIQGLEWQRRADLQRTLCRRSTAARPRLGLHRFPARAHWAPHGSGCDLVRPVLRGGGICGAVRLLRCCCHRRRCGGKFRRCWRWHCVNLGRHSGLSGHNWRNVHIGRNRCNGRGGRNGSSGRGGRSGRNRRQRLARCGGLHRRGRHRRGRPTAACCPWLLCIGPRGLGRGPTGRWCSPRRLRPEAEGERCCGGRAVRLRGRGPWHRGPSFTLCLVGGAGTSIISASFGSGCGLPLRGFAGGLRGAARQALAR